MKLRKTIYTAAAVVLLSATVSSCGIYGKYQTPTDTAITAAYAEARQNPASADSTAYGNLLWEDVFTDPVLADLINRALVNNTSLRNARLNIDVARAQLQGARLAYLPSLALAPNANRAYFKGDWMGDWTYQIPASATWEIDIFGKLLNSKRGAQVAVERSEDYAQAVRSQIIAGVANCYYAIAATESQLALARSTSLLWKQSVQTMQSLMDAGRGNKAAVVQADANYHSILAQVASLEVARQQLDNTMSLLVNVMPQHFEVAKDATLTMPEILTQGVPMQYLAMRPDVHAAEMALAAAFYNTNSARAAFLPGLSITVNGGFTNNFSSLLVDPKGWFVNLAGSLTAPIFARGQNIARLKAAKLQQQSTLNTFEYTVMSAAAEVSNALTAYQKAGERITLFDTQVDDLTKAVDYTNDLMIYGSGTYLEVLTSQQQLLSAQMNRISTQLDRTQALINLYQSMGGGR